MKKRLAFLSALLLALIFTGGQMFGTNYYYAGPLVWGNTTINAGDAYYITSGTVNLAASATLTVNGQLIVQSGATLNVNDGATLDVQSGGVVDLSSNSLIKCINACTLNVRSGGLIQSNGGTIEGNVYEVIDVYGTHPFTGLLNFLFVHINFRNDFYVYSDDEFHFYEGGNFTYDCGSGLSPYEFRVDGGTVVYHDMSGYLGQYTFRDCLDQIYVYNNGTFRSEGYVKLWGLPSIRGYYPCNIESDGNSGAYMAEWNMRVNTSIICDGDFVVDETKFLPHYPAPMYGTYTLWNGIVIQGSSALIDMQSCLVAGISQSPSTHNAIHLWNAMNSNNEINNSRISNQYYGTGNVGNGIVLQSSSAGSATYSKLKLYYSNTEYFWTGVVNTYGDLDMAYSVSQNNRVGLYNTAGTGQIDNTCLQYNSTMGLTASYISPRGVLNVSYSNITSNTQLQVELLYDAYLYGYMNNIYYSPGDNSTLLVRTRNTSVGLFTDTWWGVSTLTSDMYSELDASSFVHSNDRGIAVSVNCTGSSAPFYKAGEPGSSIGTSIATEKAIVASNYPNPFNPSTVIEYTLPVELNVTITVYDLRGAEVAKLVEGAQTAGTHTAVFDASGLPSGMYIYELRTNEGAIQGNMMLSK